MSRRRSLAAALADRVQDYMFLPTTGLLHLAKQPRVTLETRVRIEMELRRRKADSQRSDRNGRGSCRWGTEDVRNLFEELRDAGVRSGVDAAGLRIGAAVE